MIKKFMNFFFEEEEIETDFEEEMEEERVEIKEETMFYEVAQKPSTFIDLELPPKPVDVSTDSSRNAVKVDKKPVPAKKPAATEYVFTSVISPIFGSVSTDSKAVSASSVPKESQSAYPASGKDSLLGTIISPIYGKIATTPAPKETVPPVEEKTLPPLYELDELIALHDALSSADDEEPHQFSLFEFEQSTRVSEEEVREEFGISEFFDERKK